MIELRFYAPLNTKPGIWEMFPKPISWLGMEKVNLTQQKHAFTNQKNVTQHNITHTHTTVLRPFFWDHLREPEPEENFLDFMVQGKINRGRHTEHLTGRHSIQNNQCPPPPSSHNTKKHTKNLKPGLLASYDVWPGNRVGPFLHQRFINLSLTHLLRHLSNYLQPRDPHRQQHSKPSKVTNDQAYVICLAT